MSPRSAEQRDAVSLALLVLLQRLTPTERAVYVLREAVAYGYREIAALLDLTEANCRQLYRRAAGPEARFEPAPERRSGLVESFLAAAQDGNMAGLEKILAEDVTWWSDGGGKASSARRPVEGREKALRLVAGGWQRFAGGLDFAVAEVNGSPALAAGAGDALVGTVILRVPGPRSGAAFRGRVVADVRVVVNPDKLEVAGRQLTEA